MFRPPLPRRVSTLPRLFAIAIAIASVGIAIPAGAEEPVGEPPSVAEVEPTTTTPDDARVDDLAARVRKLEAEIEALRSEHKAEPPPPTKAPAPQTSKNAPVTTPAPTGDNRPPDYADGFHDLKRFGTKPMIFVTTGGRDSWARPFVHWDAVWWLSVAEVGYVADPQLKAEQNVVFYPLFPLLIRGRRPLFGSPATT